MLRSNKCAICKAEGLLCRSCAGCNHLLCFECAVKDNSNLKSSTFGDILYFLCNKCDKQFQRSKHGLHLTPEESNPTSEEIFVGKRSSEDGGQSGPSGILGDVQTETSRRYLGKFCPRCMKYQPDIRICHKCEDMFEYHCEDECWNIEDGLDPSNEKEPGKWLCYWCVTDSAESVCFQSNKKRFLRLTQDLVVDLEESSDKEVALSELDVSSGSSSALERSSKLVAWITIKPSKHLRLVETFDTITPGEIAEAAAYEDLQKYVRKVNEEQTKEVDVPQITLSVEQQELLSDALLESDDFAQLNKKKPEDPLQVNNSVNLLKVAEKTLEKLPKSGAEKDAAGKENTPPTKQDQMGAIYTLEKKLEIIQREIEEIELITRRAESANNGGRKTVLSEKDQNTKIDKPSEALSISDATIKDRIKMAHRAIQSFEVSTRQMKATPMEDLRLVLEGKVRSLLKIWEDMGKKN